MAHRRAYVVRACAAVVGYNPYHMPKPSEAWLCGIRRLTQHCCRSGLRTSRATDPLNPTYKLPSYAVAPMEQPKTPARDILYTIPVSQRVLATRDIMNWCGMVPRDRPACHS